MSIKQVYILGRNGTLTDITHRSGFDASKHLSGPTPSPARQSRKAISKQADSQTAEHILKSGDTLWDLSRRYGVTVEALKRENDITDSRSLEIGRRIKIPSDRASVNVLAFKKAAQSAVHKTPPRTIANQAFSHLGAGTNTMPGHICDILSANSILNYDSSDYENLVSHMRLREGYRTDIYKDSKGYAFGIGHKLVGDDRQRINATPQAERAQLASSFFSQDIEKSFTAATEQLRQLPLFARVPEMLNALVSVNFQLGTGWYQEHKKTWGLMTAGRFNEAAVEAADSRWHQNTPVRVRDLQTALRNTEELRNQPDPLHLSA